MDLEPALTLIVPSGNIKMWCVCVCFLFCASVSVLLAYLDGIGKDFRATVAALSHFMLSYDAKLPAICHAPAFSHL